MATLLNSESRRLYSWWWDSHICPRNSKWLQENLTDMDAKVKAMIKLIEEDADSFARRAEMYYKKRPELMKLVEDLYRAYRALAERYDHATIELRQAQRTMAEAFPNHVPYELADDSSSGSSGPEAEPHTSEIRRPILAMMDPDDLHKGAQGLSSTSLHSAKRSGGKSEEFDFGISKRGLKQMNELFGSRDAVPRNSDFAEGRMRKGLNGNEAETEIQTLKKALEEIQNEKEAILLQYKQSLEKLSHLERELNHALKDAGGLDERASKAEIEIKILKAALVGLESERDAGILQYNQCLERISSLENTLSLAQEKERGLNERAVRAETESQCLKQELSRLEVEKDAGLLHYKQCLEKISVLETKISLAEENARLLNEQIEKAENEVKNLEEALTKLNEEKEATAFLYKQCLDIISKMEDEISHSQEDTRRLNSEILLGATKLKSAEEQCDLLERSNQSLQLKANNLAQKIAVKDQELSEKHHELEKLQTLMQEEHARFKQAEATLLALQKLHSQSQEEQRALVNELKNGLQMLKDVEICKHGMEEEEDRLERLVMDFDDLDDSWPLDQILLLSNGNNNDSPSSMSPFYLSCSDQPVSPLLAFVDGGDNAVHAASASPDSSLLLSRSPNFISEMPMENVNNRRFPSPFMGLKPLDDLDGYCVIKERMTQALRYFKDLTEQNVLAQVWAPTKYGGRDVLTTSGQPFVLGPHSNGLHQFRMISLGFMFPVDEEKDGVPGLPGRVFRQRLPEWTPNVQYYSNKEYPRRDHAEHYNVQGSLALPVFDPSGRSCVGVLELIMTSPKIHYAPEVDKVCKALEAVNLKSSEILDKPHIQICNEGRQNALAEILGILTEVCETHKLPLAQTWVPCMHRSVLAHGGGLRKNCTSFDGVCMEQVCMSTTDVALYVVDARMCGFREACVEHHLQKGQGVAGRAFSSHGLCFCGNITRFCKTEYPLVHYARMFGLASCFAICLRSTFTGDDDYILELFLPPSITDFYEQQILLESLLATMKGHFQSLRVASGIELDKEVSVEIIQVSADERVDSRLGSLRVPISMKSPTRPEGLLNNGDTVQLKSSQQQLMLHSNGIHDKGATAKNGVGSINHFSLENKEMKKTSERKRGKTEKSISLEVLQQYFAGSLKDAAKSLGVCPTTMKRICRQHGISRWPSRKINKVNRSLSKLKRVIESVQGAEGAFGLDSITPSPGPVPVAVDSQPSRLNRSSPQTSPTSKLSEPQKNNELLAGRPLKNDEEVGNQEEDQLHRQRLLSPKNDIRDHSRSTSEPGKGSNRSKTRSGSCEESAGTPTSHGSCQGTPLNGSTMPKNQNVSSVNEQCIEVARSPGLAYEPPGEPCISASYLIPNTLLMPETQETFGGMLIEDAGSSKDLRNLCPAVADAMLEEQLPELSGTNPPCPSTAPNQPMAPPVHTTPHVIARNEMKSVTIKATYREDIIRFRISLSSGIMELKEEVAKRLKLEIGTFDIKYLDDDQEWVLIACDADMHECMDISRSSASNIIRLLVQDAMVNLGSSCESSG